MRSADCLAATVLVLAALGLSPAARADDVASPASAVGPAAPGRPMSRSQAIASILDAPDPSSAVEAYSRARNVATRHIAVVQAYVRRMTEFGLPEMAESQAREVLDVELSDGLARAVVAALRARRGEAEAAIAAIATAVNSDPDEPFVQRTAGQILAWHDTRAGRMAEDIESSIDLMRGRVAASAAYADAYRRAREAYETSRAAPAAPSARSEATILPDTVPADFEDEYAEADVVYTIQAATWALPWDVCSPRWSGAWSWRPTRAVPTYTLGWGCGASRFERGGGSWYGSRYGSHGSYRVRSSPLLVTACGTTPYGSYSSSRWSRRGSGASLRGRVWDRFGVSGAYSSSRWSSYLGGRGSWRGGRCTR